MAICTSNELTTITDFCFQAHISMMFPLLHSQVSATFHRSPLYARLTRMTSNYAFIQSVYPETKHDRMLYVDVKLMLVQKNEFCKINVNNCCTEMCTQKEQE